jgi:hypothetical protein
MYKLAVAMALVANTAWAEPREVNKKVICDSKESVFKLLGSDYKEEPQWHGYSPNQNTQLVLTVNPATGAWTMVEYAGDWACVIAVGERSSSRWGTPARLKSLI